MKLKPRPIIKDDKNADRYISGRKMLYNKLGVGIIFLRKFSKTKDRFFLGNFLNTKLEMHSECAHVQGRCSKNIIFQYIFGKRT